MSYIVVVARSEVVLTKVLIVSSVPHSHSAGATGAAEAAAGAASGGVVGEMRELARLVWGHLQLRWALFGMEAGQAASYFGRVAVAVGVIVVAGGLGYLAGWGVVIVWSARRWAGGDVLPPLAVMAGLHVLAALMAAWWLAARRRHQELFAATRAEFAEDRSWLHPKNP